LIDEIIVSTPYAKELKSMSPKGDVNSTKRFRNSNGKKQKRKKKKRKKKKRK
jgi:hypothetical protein